MSYSDWANFIYYEVGDRVIYLGNSYLALLANINVLPTTLAPNWQSIVNPSSSSIILESGNTFASTVINGTTVGTAAVLLTLSVTPDVVSDLSVSAVMTFSCNTATQTNLFYIISLDGVQIGRQFRTTGNGVGHFVNPTILVSASGVSATPHIVRLLVWSNTAGVFTQVASQMSVLANLA